MKKNRLIAFTLLLLSTLGTSQNVTHYYATFGLIASPSNICAGDTVDLEVGINCVCGYPYWINTHDIHIGSCSWNCVITSTTSPTIQGPNIVWHSSIPTPTDCLHPGYLPSCKVTPNHTATYTVSWEKTYTRDDGVGCSPIYPGEIIVWHYTAQTVVTVDEAPVPNLTTDKTTVKPGEQYTLSVSNCETNGQFPDFYVYIKEQCQSGNGSLYSCANNTYTLTAPGYSTTLTYKAKMKRTDPPWCESEWSPEVTVTVREVPKPNACNNDANIQAIEALLADPANLNRSDYHQYVVNNVVCEPGYSGPHTCSVQGVWNHLKSNANYQAPREVDLDDSFKPYRWGKKLIYDYFNGSNPNPIQNCQQINLPINSLRQITGVLIGLDYTAGFCTSFPIPLNPTADPVKIVVDETSKCITNYTLPGHILYPGKIRRCVYLDDCNQIRIITTGTGFHFCGSSPTGWLMGILNQSAGANIFNSVDMNLINGF